MFSQSDSISFQQTSSRSLMLRKNIRVSSSKLPYDFFNIREASRYEPKRLSLKKSLQKQNVRDIFTPSFDTQGVLSPIKSYLTQRKITTAKSNMNKDDSLIHDVIRSARNLRGVLRQKSLQMVKKSFHDDEFQLRLPKIKNSKITPLYL